MESTVQSAFALLCLSIKHMFYLIFRLRMLGNTDRIATRPPDFGGFQPFNALISLNYRSKAGIIICPGPADFFICSTMFPTSHSMRGRTDWGASDWTTKRIPLVMGKTLFEILRVGIFVTPTGLDLTTQNWHKSISIGEYERRFQRIRHPGV